ncbi:MAG: glutamyl-tRNA reductase [Kiloniellales bacterium]
MAATTTGPVEDVLVVGANHRTSPAAVRDRLFLDDQAIPGFLARLGGAGLSQALVLSTCDRVEVQAVSAETDAAVEGIARLLAEQAGMEPAALRQQLYTLDAGPAVRHVFAVAAALDSQVIGEPQVLGQLKASHRLARAAGMIGRELESLLQAAYAAAKRVRTETAVGERPVSIAAAAARLARDVHGELAHSTLLLVGLGEMGALMVEHLRAAGLRRLTVTAPAAGRAGALAHRLGGHHTPFEALASSLTHADIVIAALGRGSHAIGTEMMRETLRRRRRRPVLLIDAAIPGDVEPAVNDLDGAFLYDLDDLERVALAGRVSREAAAEAAWSIIDEEVAAWRDGQAERGAVPAITALRRHFEAVRTEVLAGAKDADAAQATRLLIGRLLHRPTEVLRRRATRRQPGEAADTERLLRRLFGLDGEEDDR